MHSGRNNKTSFVQIPLRFDVRPNRTEGILNYDRDNAYPQRVKLLTSSSVSAQSSLRLFKNFITGRGFVDRSLGETIANEENQTFDEIHAIVSEDYADYYGFAIHLQYNGLFQIEAYTVVDFETTRLTNKENKNHPNQIAIYTDWARINGNIKQEEIMYVDFFSEDPKIIQQQIAKAGGFEKWNGQIFWYSKDSGRYPTPIYDSVISDIETEAEISEGKKGEVLSSFLASHIVMLPQEFESDTERRRFMDQLEMFQGNKDRGKMLLMDGITDENKPIFQKVDTATNDRLYEFTETSIADNIRRSFLAPKELVGQEYSAGFQTDRIEQARDYYNSITEFDRTIISKQYKKIFPLFKMQLSMNYEIQKLFNAPKEITE